MSVAQGAATRPQITLVNMQTGELAISPSVPQRVQWTISPTYAIPDIYRSGGSAPHHYTGTRNMVVTMDFELVATTIQDVADASGFVRFLQSLCYSPESGTDLLTQSPPDVALLWPNYLDLVGKVMDLGGVADAFFGDGTPKRETVTVSLSEVRLTRVTSELRRDLGLRLGSVTR